MTGLCWPLLALAAVGAAFGLWQWFQRRRTLRRLGDMLDRAIAGGFAEERFTQRSTVALEGKLARFLRGSAHAQKTLEGEQAAVKALVADISHQTRTPISNLLLYASLLLESDLPAAAAGTGPRSHGAGGKVVFSHQGAGEGFPAGNGDRGSGSVPAFGEGIVGRCCAAGRTGGAGKGDRAAGTPPLTAQRPLTPRWTSEALGNVVNNAVNTPAGGTVTLCAQMLDGFCRVDVADSGPGIPEAEQGEIFNRFYRGAGTRTAEGLGLGLYLARQILTLQGGYIKVSSTPGNGSTFSLYLPRELNRI